MSQEFCAALMLAMGHFLWQGVVVAVAAAVVSRRITSASARYGMFVAALLLMSVCAGGTLIALWPGEPIETIGSATNTAGAGGRNSEWAANDADRAASRELPILTSVDLATVPRDDWRAGERQLPDRSADVSDTVRGLTPPGSPSDIHGGDAESRLNPRWQRFASWLTAAYFVGVGMMLLRLVVGLWGGWQLRRRAKPVDDRSLLDALRRQADVLKLKVIPILAYCDRVAVPTVIGIVKPTILLPLAITSGLSLEQLESVLAHELAHLKRYDHLVNLLQRGLESLLFFHPAVWWISHRIRVEREHCCDDLVVACGATPLDYATSLLRVAELTRRQRTSPSFTAVSLLATDGKPSTLRQRIARLLGDPLDTPVRLRSRWPALCLVLIGALLIGVVSSGLFADPKDDAVIEVDVPPLEFRIAAMPNDSDVEPRVPKEFDPDRYRDATDDTSTEIKHDRDFEWYPVIKPRMPQPPEKSGADLPIERQVGKRFQGLLSDADKHVLRWDNTWRVVKVEAVEFQPNAQPDAPQFKNTKTFEIRVQLDEVGGAALSRLTQAHVNQKLAIVVDGEIVAAPVIRQKFASDFTIVGIFTRKTTDQISAALGRKVKVRRKDDESSRRERCDVELPNGIKVELVGLAAMKAEPKEWWKPDGTPLAKHPVFDKSIFRHGDHEMRRVVLRVHGGLSYLDVTTPGMSNSRWDEAHGSGGPFVRVDGGYAMRPGEKTGKIRLGVAMQPLSPVRLLDPTGVKLPSPANAPVDHIAEDIEVEIVTRSVSRNTDRPEETWITWRSPLSDDRPIDLDLRLIDKKGNSHQRTSQHSELTDSQRQNVTYHFAVPFNQVARFEYQMRTYQHWVTFDNVSLQPGEMTDVKVEVMSPPPPIKAEFPDGRSVEFVGITKNTRPANDGWRPDGRAIGDVGYWPSTIVLHGNTQSTYVENGPHPEPNATAIDFLFRIRGFSSQPSLRFELPMSSSGFPHRPWKEPHELRVSADRRIEGKDVIRVGLSDDRWGEWLQVDLTGKVLNPLTAESLYRSHYESIEVVGVKEHERAANKLALVLKHPADLRSQVHFQIRGVDVGGKEQNVAEWDGYGREQGLWESHYGLGTAEKRPLTRYEFRLRPYRHWVTFRNVSLEPGRQTEVAIEIQSREPPVAPNGKDVKKNGLKQGDEVVPAEPKTEPKAEPQPLPPKLRELKGKGVSVNRNEAGQTVSLYLGAATTDDVLAEVPLLTELRELHIETTKNVSASGLAHLGKLPRLEKASFYSVNTEGAELGDAAVRSVADVESLRELSVSECGLTDEGCKLIAGMKQLTRLELSEGRLTDEALKSIGESKQLKSLSLSSYVGSVRLGRMQFSEEALLALRELDQLEELGLVGQPVTAEVLASNKLTSLGLGHASVDYRVAQRVAELSALKSLNLVYCGITDDGFRKLAGLKQLGHLDVSSYHVTDAGFAAFEKHPALNYVSVRASRVTDDTVRSLATIPTLNSISLYGSGEPGFAPASDVTIAGLGFSPRTTFTIAGLLELKALPNLHLLSLTNFKTGGSYLSLKELTQLKSLSMMMCDVREDDLKALDEALPETLVQHMTGGGGYVSDFTKKPGLLKSLRSSLAPIPLPVFVDPPVGADDDRTAPQGGAETK